jgi:hypothetical protein
MVEPATCLAGWNSIGQVTDALNQQAKEDCRAENPSIAKSGGCSFFQSPEFNRLIEIQV